MSREAAGGDPGRVELDSAQLAARLRLGSRILGGFAALLGLLPLVGWIVDDDGLKGLASEGLTVKANTAVALLMGGIALVLLAPERRGAVRTALGKLLAAVIAAIGAATLFEHLSGVNLGIDELLFSEQLGAAATQSPNRMGPPASLAFPLLGGALLLLDRRRRALARGMALAAVLIALVPILGYVFHVRELFGIARFTGIAFPTALAFAALGLGVLVARTGDGQLRLLSDPGAGGIMVRRLLPAAILLPVVIARLRIAGEERGLYDAAFGRSLLVFGFILAFSVLIWWTARVVARYAEARARAEASEVELRRQLQESLESERAARSAAESASQTKDEFLATLSHELRSPLNAVLGWAQVLSNGGIGAEDARHGVEVIERNSRLQAKLIDDLLDMSRIERGILRLEVHELDLGSVLEAALSAAAPTADAKEILLESQLEPDPAPVVGDPDRLQQVFTNLLNNAVRFTEAGGRVRVTSRIVGDKVEVAVSDTGIGIAEDFLPQVFGRFRQADGSTTRRHGGLGLGLAIAHQLTQLHGGTLEAASDGEGRGATFTFCIPLAGPATGALALEREAAEQGERLLAGVRVLVVDDQPDARELVQRVLRARGAEVELAEDADQALRIVEQSSIDVLVSDISMPGRDGYELLRAVRTLRPDMPAIALTAFVRREDEDRARRSGYSMHLPKPFQPVRLAAAVASLARQHRA
jgi:signal transduction histidine kinase